jgi:hypothetical protein
MAWHLKTGVSETSNTMVNSAIRNGGYRVGIVAAVPFLLLSVYALWLLAWKALVICVAATVLMPVLAPIAWAVGDAIRRAAAPEAVVTTGLADTLKQRAFWLLGPQLIACGLVVGVPLLLMIPLFREARALPELRKMQARQEEVATRQRARATALAKVPTLDAASEQEFRTRVRDACSRRSLPLGDCVGSVILGANCVQVGIAIPADFRWPDEYSIDKTRGTIPVHNVLATGLPAAEAMDKLVLHGFLLAITRFCDEDVQGSPTSDSPCAGRSSNWLTAEVGEALGRTYFEARGIPYSGVEKWVWDTIAAANGPCYVAKAMGPYPFDRCSDAFVQTWDQLMSHADRNKGSSVTYLPPGLAMFPNGVSREPRQAPRGAVVPSGTSPATW